jgi:hypothetical protein
MDYTTLANVRADAHIVETTDDALISRKITQASRAIDRLVTGREDAIDYFKSEAISGEILSGYRNPLIDNHGRLLAWPHKPIITAVSAIAFRMDPTQGWQSLDTQSLMISGGKAVEVWGTFLRGRSMVQISYTGGLGAATANLPDDLQELATLLTIRFYKESQSGMSDTIGINDLGTVQYIKALPIRVQDGLARYTRNVPW